MSKIDNFSLLSKTSHIIWINVVVM